MMNQKNNRRNSVSILALSLLVLFLAGCSTPESAPEPASAVIPELVPEPELESYEAPVVEPEVQSDYGDSNSRRSRAS